MHRFLLNLPLIYASIPAQFTPDLCIDTCRYPVLVYVYGEPHAQTVLVVVSNDVISIEKTLELTPGFLQFHQKVKVNQR
jgi:hypothetical protein